MQETQSRHTPTWSGEQNGGQSYGRVAATLGGALLTIYGLRRGAAQGLGMAAAGGAILYRALNGNWPVPSAVTDALPDLTNVEVKKSVGIMKSPDDVYHFWRDFTNLPQFMKHLKNYIMKKMTMSKRPLI